MVGTSLVTSPDSVRVVLGSATEDRLDVLGVVTGRVEALRAGPDVMLLQLVVHVLDPGHQIVAGGVQVRMGRMVCTSASVSRSSPAILVAAV